MDKLEEGKRVFDIEINALKKTRSALNDTFVRILDAVLACEGKIILTGMGKPGHIARKLAATFASLGTPAFCLHPGDAMHGDLGMVSSNDVVIAISLSGESYEVIQILPAIRMIGATIIGITANQKSTLAKFADIIQVLPVFEEACYLDLAPTSSTTVELCYGDALAVVASKIYGFQKSDFGKLHPAGALGKKLTLTVNDLMVKGTSIPKIPDESFLKDAIIEISQKKLGLVAIVDKTQTINGIITDGDLRRSIQSHTDIYTSKVEEVMNRTPKTIKNTNLAVDALKHMKIHNINNLLVVDDNNKLIGAITMLMIIKAGIVL